MTIGEKIKRLRKEYDMTQEELGNAIGVQKAAINKYETGVVVNLKRDVIQKLANALRVNPVWLMDEDAGWPPVPSTHSIIASAFVEARKEDEDQFVCLYRSLSDENQKAVRKYMEFLKLQEGN